MSTVPLHLKYLWTVPLFLKNLRAVPLHLKDLWTVPLYLKDLWTVPLHVKDLWTVPLYLNAAPRSCTKTLCLVWTVVDWSEKGDLKKVVMMSVRVCVTYFSRAVSACFLNKEN